MRNPKLRARLRERLHPREERRISEPPHRLDPDGGSGPSGDDLDGFGGAGGGGGE